MFDQAALEAQIQKSFQTINDRIDALNSEKKSDETGVQILLKSQTAQPTNKGASDEQRAMRAFGCSDVKSLMVTNVMDPKFKHVPEELKYIVLDTKKALDVARWTAQIFHDAPRDHIGNASENDRAGRVKNLLDTHYGKEELAPRLKSFLSTGTGVGKEYVETLISASYIDEFSLPRVIEDKMQSFNMPSAEYGMTIVGGSTKARQIAENTAIIDKNFTTSKLSFAAKKLGEFYIIPEELNEDSIVPFLELGRMKNIEAQQRAVEAAIINGDDDGTHIDSDFQALPADIAEKLWKGLRRQALANTANGGTVDFGNSPATQVLLNTMRARMGKFGVNPAQLLYIFGPGNSIQLQALDQVNTIEKYGPRATIITGELEKFGGVPIVVSEAMRNDLNATGVYDGTTVNRSGIILVNASRWWIGRRRPITLRVEQDLPNQDRWLVASYQRLDFKGMPQSATETSVVYGYNVAS